MLGLDVLQHRPIIPLESSVIRTVTHRWPVLYVPFIHELNIGPDPGSDPGNLDRIALHVNVQKTHYSVTEPTVDTQIIPELASCARKEDTRELLIINSAVMLDAVENVTPVEICHSAENIMLQESGESSDLQIREDFFEITIAHDLTNRRHMKDGHDLSDPVSKMNDEAAGMDVMSTGTVLQSKQRESVGNLLNEPNREESTSLERSDSIEVLTDTASLAAAKTWTPIDESPEGFPRDECTLISSSHQCSAYKKSDEDSVKCLEVDHLSGLQSTSTQRTFDPVDFPKVSTRFHETSTFKDPGFSCINEVCSATCLLKRMEPNTADDINAPKENVPRSEDLDRSVESIQPEIETTSSDEKQNNLSMAYLSQIDSAKTAGTRLHDIQSNASKVVVCDGTSLEILKDDLSFKPNLPPCFENLTGAKTLDTEDCSFFFSVSDCNTPLIDCAPDCHKYTCAIKLEDRSDQSPHNAKCSAPLASICDETSCTRSTSSSSLVDHSETSYIDFSLPNKDSELDGENEELLSMSVAPYLGLAKNTKPDLSSHGLYMETEKNQCNVPHSMVLHLLEGTKKVITQSQGLCDMVPAVINDPTTAVRIVEESHCLLDIKDSSCGLSDPNAVIHDVFNCEEPITSHIQSNLITTIKETVLTSSYLKVPCRTVDNCINETPSYALVPYIDIWDSFSKSEGNSQLSLRTSKNVICKEVESRELNKDEYKGSVKQDYLLEESPERSLKDNCMLKAFMNPEEIVDLSHSDSKCKDEPCLDSLSNTKALLAQDVTCNVSADSFPCHKTKMHDSRTSNVPSILKQSKGVCHFHSGALPDPSVTLDLHHISVLAQLVDARHAGDTLQSEQTNVCSLKEKCTPLLSLSNHHLNDCSALSSPTLPASPVTLSVSENRKERHTDVILDNLQLHFTNHAGSSLQRPGDLRKSVPRKQDIKLRPRCRTTLKEPFKASDSVHCMQILATEGKDPTQSVQPAILHDNRSLHMSTSSKRERNPSPVKSVVAIKAKATRVKSQRNVFHAEMKILKTSLKDCQFLKEKPRQSVGCHLERPSGATGNRKTYNLRPAPQSLKCSASQETKRPKIYHENAVCPAASQLSHCGDPHKFKSHQLSQIALPCKRKEPPTSIKTPSCLSTSVKRQLDRRCKNLLNQDNVPNKIETLACKTSPVLKIHNSHNINLECKSLTSKQVDLNLSSKPQCSKLTRGGAVSETFTHLQKSTQDTTKLLNTLSTIANRLTSPSRSETFSSNLKVLPFRGVKFQARKLLSLFSCVNMRMNSQPGQIWQENVCLTSSRNRLVSQSWNLYPTPFPKTSFSSLDGDFSLDPFANLTFPVSFHVNVDPSCLSDFVRLNPPDYILSSPPSAQSSKLSEWTLSLFLSSHVPADTDNVHLLTQFRSLESTSESSHTMKSVRDSGSLMPGLHTVLALSSPGCYRLWTRRRHLGSQIPTVQKLSVMQFAHGFKGSAPQFSKHKHQFSSFAFSLGRVLSTWSQHGLSAFSSDRANTHPNCRVWLPSESSNSISVQRSPNPFVCVPQMPLNTIHPLNLHSLPVKKLNLALKSRLFREDDRGLPFCLSTQRKDDPTPPCWLSTQCKNEVELSNCSFKQEDGPKFSLFFSALKKDNSNLQLDPCTQQNNLERPLNVSSLKRDLAPVVNISLQKDQNCPICLDSLCDVSIHEDAAVHLPYPESPPKSQVCPFEHRESIIIPSKRSQNKHQVNETGVFDRKPQRVSQIRIRKTIPKPDPNLTPMGLPKPKRVNKKEFSLEDIYTNKNYKSPPTARSLETIFEEPKEKNGVLISVSQQKRKRILEFRDCTVPRVKRPKGKLKVMTSCKRGRKAAMEGVQLDALLIQKLMDLENSLLEEEAMERGSATSGIAS